MEEQLDPTRAIVPKAHKLATARSLPLADLLLVAVCWVMIWVASIAIAVLPSRRILRTLGPHHGAVTRVPSSAPRQQERAWRIARAVGIAGRNAPFRSDCYPRALVAAQLCRWFAIPHVVQLGARFAAPDSARYGGLEGHAWVRSEGVTVSGGSASAHQFGTVACFVHIPRSVGIDASA